MNRDIDNEIVLTRTCVFVVEILFFVLHSGLDEICQEHTSGKYFTLKSIENKI